MIRLLFSLLHTILFALLGHIIYPLYFVGGEKVSRRFFANYARILFWLNGITIVTEGLEHITVTERYLIVANHQSLFDIPALFAALPISMRFFAKRELGWIPLFGSILILYGNVVVNRADARGAVKALGNARRLLAHSNLVIFPEGTRSPDGRVYTFKTGGLSLAFDTGRQILPVAIEGTGRLLPKRSLLPCPGVIRIKVFPPVKVDGITDRKILAKQLEEVIRSFVETSTKGGSHG